MPEPWCPGGVSTNRAARSHERAASREWQGRNATANEDAVTVCMIGVLLVLGGALELAGIALVGWDVWDARRTLREMSDPDWNWRQPEESRRGRGRGRLSHSWLTLPLATRGGVQLASGSSLAG